MDKGLNRHLHMQELGLQGLYKQLLSHSLCQGICNHLGAREHVSCIQTPSQSLLKNPVSSHSPQICQRALVNQGHAGIGPQVTVCQLYYPITAMRPSWSKKNPGRTCPTHRVCLCDEVVAVIKPAQKGSQSLLARESGLIRWGTG